jgi:DNA (cytosine-5)-methyltransferase 1
VNACGTAAGRQDFETETFVAHALTGNGFDASEDGTGRGTPIVLVAACEIADTLSVGANQTTGFASDIASVGSTVRRLTPRECERLQGFPDDYTAIPYRNGTAADGPRYKALGNSMAVPVMRAIGERIKMVDALP